MKRCLEALVLSSVLATSGCTVPVKETPPIPAYAGPCKVLGTGLDYLALKDYPSVRSHFCKYHQQTPSMEYLVALSYVGDGNIFNGGLFEAGNRLQELIFKFMQEPYILSKMQEDLEPLFELEEYQKNKKSLLGWVSAFPRELTPIYAFMCTVEGNYDEAAKAWSECKQYWPNHLEKFRNAFKAAKFFARIEKNYEMEHGLSFILLSLVEE